MKTPATVLAILLLWAGAPGVAQDSFAPVLEACLNQSDREEADAGCRDLVYNACLAASGDETTIGMSECLVAETQAWDAQLNALWPEVTAMAKALDAEERGGGTPNQDALLAAQRAWIAFRDAECSWAWQRWSQGTIRTLIAGSCQRDLTASRVTDFRGWLQRGQ